MSEHRNCLVASSTSVTNKANKIQPNILYIFYIFPHLRSCYEGFSCPVL